jgi:hypothetical protein
MQAIVLRLWSMPEAKGITLTPTPFSMFLATSVPIVAKRHPAISANPHNYYIANQEKLPLWQLVALLLTESRKSVYYKQS